MLCYMNNALACNSKKEVGSATWVTRSVVQRAAEGNLQGMKQQPRQIMLDGQDRGRTVISSVHIQWFVHKHRLVAHSYGEYRAEPPRLQG